MMLSDVPSNAGHGDQCDHREDAQELARADLPSEMPLADPADTKRATVAAETAEEDTCTTHKDLGTTSHYGDAAQGVTTDEPTRRQNLEGHESSAPPAELSGSESLLEDIQPADNDDSDFRAEDSPEDSLGSDSGFDDDSQGSGRRTRKGKRASKKRKERTPPDNEQTRKLRSRVEESEPPERVEEESDFEADDQKPQVLERHVTLAEEEEQQGDLQTMWEMADVLDFLRVFSRDIPGLSNLEWTANGLESALITSTGGPGLLASIHMELLRPMLPRGATMTSENWTVYFANLLRRQWRDHYLPGDPPFAPAKGDEALTYTNLPTEDRLLALKALCEARLDRELYQVVDDAIKPPRLPKGAKEHGGRGSKRPAPRTLEDFRLKPLGRDSSGFVFYWLDLGSAGSRLYKETPQRLISKGMKASQAKKGRVGQPGWELQASSVEELQTLGEKVRRSRDRNDQRLASELLDVIVPQLAARIAEEERKAKAAARLRLQLSTIIPDSEGGFGRPRRARKEVNYTFEGYDSMIRHAIRSERPKDKAENGRSRRGLSPPRPTAEEEARAGLRRGRSAAAVVLTGRGAATDTPDIGTPASTPAQSDMNDAEQGSDNPDGNYDADDAGTETYSSWPSRPSQPLGLHSGRELQHYGGSYMAHGGSSSFGHQEPTPSFLAPQSYKAAADAKWPQYHDQGAGGHHFHQQSPQADLPPQGYA